MSTNDPKCTCGGCGTGTACCHSTGTIKDGAQNGTFAYMAPEMPLHPHYPHDYQEIGNNPGFHFLPDDPKKTLLEEMVKDLLERVQLLETVNTELVKNVKEIEDTLAKLKGRPADDVFAAVTKLFRDLGLTDKK